MSVHGEQAFVDWVVGVLEAGDLVVGDGVAPTDVPAGSGYVVVYSIAGGITEGSLDDPRSDATAAFQVTSVGDDPRQVRWLIDKVRSLLNTAIPGSLVDGRRVIWLEFPTGSASVIRDDDRDPPGWYSPDRFEVGTS